MMVISVILMGMAGINTLFATFIYAKRSRDFDASINCAVLGVAIGILMMGILDKLP